MFCFAVASALRADLIEPSAFAARRRQARHYNQIRTQFFLLICPGYGLAGALTVHVTLPASGSFASLNVSPVLFSVKSRSTLSAGR